MQNIHPLVSILVPVYGVEKYIARCAKSLFEQTYDNIDYVFVDDCTPDNSITVLKTVLSNYPNRKDSVRIIKHEKNQGLAVARNTAVAAAKGEYLMHVDSDDWIDIKTVELCVNKLKGTNADYIYFNIIMHKTNVDIHMTHNYDVENPQIESQKILARKEPVCVWGGFIKTSLYRDNNIYLKPGMNNGEDYDTTPKLCYNAKSLAFVKKDLYHYDFTNEGSYSHVFSQKKWEQTWRVIEDLHDYFSNKGQDYLNALNSGVGGVLSHILIDIGKYNGGKEYFNIIRQRVKQLDMRYVDNPIPYRLVLYIPNYRLLQVYCKLSSFFKKKVK